MEEQPKIRMYGGLWGGLMPLTILLFLLFVFSMGGKGGIKAFWTAGWIALFIGLFLARNKRTYCISMMEGIGDKNGIVIVTAWLFAGVFGKLMVAGGLVDGLLWLGLKTGATGALFALISFFIAMLFSMGTGTSTGTVLSLIPVLYPAGVFLGADPWILALGILSGAAFGDNLAPISDTTIVSAYTQEADMRDVVKSRFPLAVSAAMITALIILFFGRGESELIKDNVQASTDPIGLLMFLGFIVVVTAALRGRHLIESLIYGNLTAISIGLITRKIVLSDIFTIPSESGQSSGIIQNGIEGVVGAIIFAVMMMAITQVLLESGIIGRILKSMERLFIKTVKQAELSIIFVTILASIPIASNAAAELLVGPSLVKPIGKKFNLAPARKANLMDCAVCTIFYTLPWDIAVIVWFGAVKTSAETFGIPSLPIHASLFNPYSWALLAIIIISAMTGWNRKYDVRT